MAHTKQIENVRVQVYPDFGRGWFTPAETDVDRQKQMAQDVVQQIKRHVDNIDGARVVWDTRWLCEFCGYDLTDEPHRISDGEAIPCCDEQIGAWHERHGVEISDELFPGTREVLASLTVKAVS